MLYRAEKNRGAARRNNAATVALESLEHRVLFHHGFGFGHGGFGHGFGGGGFGHGLNAIEFNQAPAAVQTGLENLATQDGLTPPTSSSTQTVFLGNRNGVETYSIDLVGTGTISVLTVDQTGNAVTAPTNGTTTYGAVPAAVSSEASAIASALSLTVPDSTANVHLSTPAGGTSVYTIRLSSAATSTSSHVHARTFLIDANGNPVGSARLPFVAIPSGIQSALNDNRPSGADALTSDSTQNVSVRTSNGITTYSTNFVVSGITTTVTVTAAGALAKLPSHTTTTFSTLSVTVQTAINTIASENGVTTPIADTQSVQVYDEANGTTVYSINATASKTSSFSGRTFTFNLTIAVDQDGNPTTVPSGGDLFGSAFGDFKGRSFFGGSGFFGRRHR